MIFTVKFNETSQRLKANFGEVQYVTVGEMTDYNYLDNRPMIESVTLEGDKSFSDLGLVEMSNEEILNIAKQIFKGE